MRLTRFGFLLVVTVAFMTAATPGAPTASEKPYSKVYLDDHRNVHAVTAAGRDVSLTKKGRYSDPKLSPDGRTVGFGVLSRLEPHPEEIQVTREISIYREGRTIRRIVPGGFIRSWSFWSGGKQLAIYSGALHFAGFYVLYDVSTGKVLQRSEDPVNEQTPDWVRAVSE